MGPRKWRLGAREEETQTSLVTEAEGGGFGSVDVGRHGTREEDSWQAEATHKI